MRNSIFSDREIYAFIREVESGVSIDEICRIANVSQRTFYRWRKRLGGLPLASARKVRELEAENRRLRTILSKLAGNAGAPAVDSGSARQGSLRSDVGCDASPPRADRPPTVVGRYASIRVRP